MDIRVAASRLSRYLARMRTNATIAGMIEGQYSVTVFCKDCDHRADLDLEALSTRLGPEHGALADTLLPKLRCSACGGRRLGMTVGTTRPV